MIKKRKSSAKSEVPKVEEEIPKTSQSKTTFFVLIIIIVVLTATFLMISDKFKNNKAQNAQKNTNHQPAQQAEVNKTMDKSDISALITRVSQLISIKNNEEPTVATVQDSEMLKASNPVFYKDVENGDRLLVWSDKAVLYSVKQDKLLSVMPILGDQQQDQGMATTTAAVNTTSTNDIANIKEKVVIEVRNGTRTAGLARSMSELLKSKGYTIGNLGDAVGKTYEKTMIIKTSEESSTATMAELQSSLNGEIVELPTGEAPGKSDILVIVGGNYNQ